LSTQVSRSGDAWVRLLRGHAALRREFSAKLLTEHGLSVNDFECLLLLSKAEEQSMRRVDLAAELQLSPSGVTRMLDGLEADGFVEKAACSTDARVTYAVITDAGLAKLKQAADSHMAAVDAAFEARYTARELDTLAELLGRLPGAERATGEECDVGELPA
jgi:DNA-binding MarR family transcriptional regulator